MAEDTSKVEVKLDADIAGFVARMKQAERSLKSFKREAAGMSSGAAGRSFSALEERVLKTKKSFDSFDKGVKMLGTGLTKFLGLAIKGVLIQMAAMGAAMLAIHGAFVIGNGLAKAYAATMKVFAGGAAGLAVALSTVASALREQQAAMFAFSGGGAAQLGSGLNQTRTAMRALATDSDLAVLGMANLNKAYGAMAKSMTSTQILGSKNLMKALFDFGAAGQDPAQAAEKIGVVIEALNNSKKSFSEVQAAAKELGPQMEKALTKMGITTKKKFQEALLSGDLAKEGGVFGQFAAVNSTLISRVKAFFNIIKEEFADFGQKFLEPAKVAMERIMRIIRRDLMRVGAELSAFGTGGFFEGLVTAVDKTSNFFVKLIREYLPGAKGIFQRIGDFFNDLGRGWDSMVRKLEPFIEGARVIESIFSPLWRTIKEEGVESFNSFNQQLIENSASFKEFGERLAGLLESAFELGRTFREIWMESLPFINDVLSGVKQIFDMLTGIVSGMSSAFGATGGLMAFAIAARQMKGTSGGLLTSVTGKTMTLNPQTVVVNAPGAPPVTFQQGGPPNRYGGAGVAPAGTGVAPPGGRTGQSSGRSGGGGQTTQVPGGGGQPTAPPAIAGPPVGYFSGKKLYQLPTGPYSKITGRAQSNRSFALGNRLRELRGTRGGVALLGDSARGITGIANSMGAKMGVGMGLSMASQYAPEEMRGAMALGGTVGMFNPIAGLAIAGLGGAMSARSAGGGALAGLAGGAAAGAMVAGPVGAAIGGALGALGGALMGGANKIKMEAKEAAFAINTALKGMITTSMQGVGSTVQANIEEVRAGRNTEGSVSAISGLTARYLKQTAGASAALRDPVREAVKQQEIYMELARRASTTAPGELMEAEKLLNLRKEELTRVFKNIQRNPAGYGGFTLTGDMLKKIEKSPIAAGQEFLEQNKTQFIAVDAVEKQTTARMDRLRMITGKTNAELEAMAHELGYPLYDSTVKFTDVLQGLGITLVKTAEQMRQANVDVFVSSGDVYQSLIKQSKASEIINEQAEAMRVALSGGGVKAPEIFEFLSNIQASVLDRNMGDPLAAFREITGQIGNASNPGKVFGPGGVFQNIDPATFFLPEVQNAYGQYERKNMAGFRGNAASQITSLLASEGKMVDANVLDTALSSMSRDEQLAFYSALETMKVTDTGTRKSFEMTTAGGVKSISMGSDVNAASAIMNLLGLSGMNVKDIEGGEATQKNLNNVANNLDTYTTELQTAIMDITKKTGDLFVGINSTPEWMKPDALRKAFEAAGFTGDTSSPRGRSVGDTTSSRLSQTMARHSAVDGMLTGTRSITSSYRTYALGSPSSDHVTGRAIDLVGANLGQYKQLTEKAGGFAEFHGRGASRHLHVVPGPGAIGDTMVPASLKAPSVMAPPSVSGGSNNYYTFNINGSNASPDEIANRVMAKIKDQQRAERER